jgi:8-oxo-dGTP pyrophosphatase MutT (NUDIX family)
VTDPQPLLHSGDLALYTWSAERHDAVASVHRQVQQALGSEQPPLLDLAVVHAGALVGAVGMRLAGDGRGVLSVALLPASRGAGAGIGSLHLVTAYAFSELGLKRVEALVDPSDSRALRMASRAGLRREGVLRSLVAGPDGRREDRVLVARLADDVEPTSADGFRALLNAGLPTKRVIAQGLLRDADNRVLLCELVYKRDWDLPGGVVERGESPRDCLRREVLEELGIDIEVGELLTVDWLPPWAGWDDACLLMFDLGRIDAALTSRMRLQPREIAAVHWADADVARRHCRPQVADRLELATSGKPVPPFLHSGQRPD